jgi:acyl-coenzyme A synthetase/AMP-(fatty) acid ligase
MKIDPSRRVIEEGGEWRSWGELDRAVSRLRTMFDEAGLPEGGRVALLFRNRFAQAAAVIACILSDRCIVSLNPLMSAERLVADLRLQDPAILIGEASDLDIPGIRSAAEELECPMIMLASAGRDALPEWAGARHAISERAGARVAPDILVEMQTSGTTGTPKRVPLSKASFDEALVGANAYESKQEKENGLRLRSGVRIITAPLNHISGFIALVMSLAAGRNVALLEKFAVEPWLSAVQRHQVKVVNVPPTALKMVMQAGIGKEELSSLVAVRTGTAPLDPALADAFMERYAIPILQQYGATEFTGGVAGWTMRDFREHHSGKRGSVGRVQPNIEARVIDPETGQILPAGAHGVLEIRGRQLGPDNEWRRTTDIASLDADGFLWIHGRADNAIIRGGFKVHPDEVAAVLEQHPAIREAAVVGLSDSRLGEIPAAAVVLKPDAEQPSEDDIVAFLRTRLLPYQIPGRIKFVAELPRNNTLKPIVPDLRRLFEAA